MKTTTLKTSVLLPAVAVLLAAAPAWSQVTIERTILVNQTIPDRGQYVSSFEWANAGLATISDVNVRLSLSAAPGDTMRLGQMYATLTHGVASESERVAVLLNRPGVTDTNSFGSSLGSFQAWFDDSGSDSNVFFATSSTGIYQADGRLGVDPLGTRVAYNPADITAGLSALNGDWLASGLWSLLVADAQTGRQAQLDSWRLRVVGTAAESGTLEAGDGGVISATGEGVQTVAAAVVSTGSGENAVRLEAEAGRELLLTAGLVGEGDFVKQGEGILRLAGASTNFTGTMRVAGGQVELASSTALGPSGSLSFEANARLAIANSVVLSNVVRLGANTQAEMSVSTGDRAIIAGPIQNGEDGAGQLLKTGSGRLVLSGTNTYSGPTVVQEGRLQVSGAITNSTVTVQSNAVLSGSGAVGETTLLSGATIAPGDSPGVLTNVGNLTWSGGSFYDWEIFNLNSTPGTGWDLIDVTDQLLFTNISALNPFSINLISLSQIDPSDTIGALAGWNPLTNYSWTILSTSNGIVGFDASYFTLNLANFTNNNSLSGGLFSLASDGSNLNLLFTAATLGEPVPEPGTWAAAALLLLTAVYLRWRRSTAAR